MDFSRLDIDSYILKSRGEWENSFSLDSGTGEGEYSGIVWVVKEKLIFGSLTDLISSFADCWLVLGNGTRYR